MEYIKKFAKRISDVPEIAFGNFCDFEEDIDIIDIESDQDVEELLENDEISSEEAGFLHGWNRNRK